MNNFTKITAAVLVLIAVLLGIFALVLGRKPPVPATINAHPLAASTSHPLIIADRPLVAGKPIDATEVKLADLPIVPAGAFTAASAVVGKIPRTTISAGMPITDASLASGLPMQLAADERGVAVPVDEVVGAGNEVQPGDYVDVFFTLREGPDISKTQARLLLSHIRVLAYGADTLGPNGVVRASAQPDPNRVAQQARTAVLAVPVQDVDSLILGTEAGKLVLALREPGDDLSADTALFPTPQPILAARAGLDAQQVAALTEPDNQAYSGIALAGLAGDNRAVTHPLAPHRAEVVHRRTGGGNSIEIIRGTASQDVTF